MLNATRLRVSLAIITLAGAFHLDNAPVAEPGRVDCDSYASWYADGYCAAKNADWSSVTYSCNGDGTARIHSVSCLEEPI